MTTHGIAKICHEANRYFCDAIGDSSQHPWEEAEDWQRDSAVAGVCWRLENTGAPASAQHEAWCDDKRAAGWKHGLVKDADKKEHPCLINYDQLPPEQKAKDALFVAIVKALSPLLP